MSDFYTLFPVIRVFNLLPYTSYPIPYTLYSCHQLCSTSNQWPETSCQLAHCPIRLELLMQRFARDTQTAGGFAFVPAGGLHSS